MPYSLLSRIETTLVTYYEFPGRLLPGNNNRQMAPLYPEIQQNTRARATRAKQQTAVKFLTKRGMEGAY